MNNLSFLRGGYRTSRILVAEGLESRTLLSAGSLDPGFGGTGEVITPLGGNVHAAAGAIVPLAGGKILVAAEDFPNVAILQYLPNGQLDPSFGTGGKKIIGFGAGRFGQNLSLSVQSDGRILLAGDDEVAATQANEAFILRLKTNGILDTTFGAGGELHFHLGSNAAFYSIASLPSGKMIIATTGDGTPGFGSFIAERLTSSGSTDASFGTGGVASVKVHANALLDSIAIQPDGKIVLGGTAYAPQNSGSAIQLARLTISGSPDTAFGANGAALGSNNAVQATGIAIQGDGKIIAAGGETAAASFYLQRFNTDGSVDASFGGNNGVTTLFPGANYGVATAIAVQMNGRVIAAGDVDGVLTLVRYTATGAPDLTFGAGGKVATAIQSATAFNSFPVAIQPNGEIITAGGVAVSGQDAIAVVRYDGDAAGLLDASFGNDGITGPQPWSSFANFPDTIVGVASQSDGKVIVGGTTPTTAGIARFSADGATADPTFGTGGFVNTDVMTLAAFALQGNGDLVLTDDSPSGDGSIALQRYTPSGTLDVTFGTGGTVKTSIPGGTVVVSTAMILSNGEILVAGTFTQTASPNMACPIVVRYTTAGKVDNAFSQGGMAIVGSLANMLVRSIAVQGNGDILLGGTSDLPDGGRISVARLLSTGSPDRSFGVNGLAAGQKLGSEGRAVFSESDGSVVIGGDFGPSDLIMRFTPMGKLDTTFGANGMATGPNPTFALALENDHSFISVGLHSVSHFNPSGMIDATETPAGGVAVALESSGDILVAGNGGIARLTPLLALDTAFGRNGTINSDAAGFNGLPTAIAVQSNGKILVAGADQQFNWNIERYNTDGSIDTTFGSAGLLTLHEAGNLNSMVLDSMGRILLAGDTGAQSNVQTGLVARLNSNGTLDTTFGSGGFFAATGGLSSIFNAIVVQPDGRVVVGGESTSANFVTSFTVQRLLITGKLDPSFGAGGVATTSFLGINDVITSLAIQKDGKIVAGGFATNSSGGSSYAVARYTTAGKLDSAFGASGRILFTLGPLAVDQGAVSQLAIDSQGRIVIGGNDGNFNGTIVRLTPSGQFDKTFASAGVYVLPNPLEGTGVDSLIILPGDKILAGGFASFSTGGDEESAHPRLGGTFPDFMLSQLTSAGAADPSFGTDGVYLAPVDNTAQFGFDAGHAIALQADGDIVAAALIHGVASVARFTGP